MYNTKKMSGRLLVCVLTMSMLTTLLVPLPVVTQGEKTVKAAETTMETPSLAALLNGNDGSQGLTELPELTTTSVDDNNVVKVWKNSSNKLYYSVYRKDKVVIECSEIGLVTVGNDLSTGLILDESSVVQTTGKEEYDLIQGSTSRVSKEYKETAFTVTKNNSKVTIYFRVFEDGMAYRYVVDGDTTSTTEITQITSENSNFVLPATGTYWTNSYSSTYEASTYVKRNLSTLASQSTTYSTPILSKLGEENGDYWVLLTEANIYNEENPYCSSVFETKSNSRALKVKFGNYLKEEQDASNDGQKFSPTYGTITSVNMTDVFKTPWRLAIIADDLEGVTNSSLVADLNPAAQGDFSWVKPGTSAWSWWSGSKDNIGYESMYDYIDFAAESKMEYCLVDYGWELWTDYETKVKNLVKYADEKGVALILWYGVHKFDNAHIFDLVTEDSIESAFAWCESVGVKGVKMDYINSDSQFAMKTMYLLADRAAKHHLVINYHGATDPNGENRTYPNILSSEAVCGMEYFKWSSASPIQSLLTLPYTRNVLGSMEYTPSAYRVANSDATYGFMLAMSVVYESAVQTFAHSAYVYPGYNGLSLLKDIPSSWDESRLLDGYPGESVVRARRSGDNWYVGAMTNNAANYDVSLNFLEPNTAYYAYIYKDNEVGDNIEISTQEVTSESVLNLELKQFSGCSIKITKSDPLGTTKYDRYKYYEAENAEMGGKATIIKDQYCASGMKYVDSIGSGAANSITFKNINVREDGEYALNLYVITSTAKNIYVQANEESPVLLSGVTGTNTDYRAVGFANTKVTLKAGDNTIRLYNNTASAPGIDRIAVAKLDFNEAEVTIEKDSYDYTGQQFKPSVTAKRNGAELKEGEDYTVTYFDNMKVGTASVSIMGINDFAGTITKKFSILGTLEPIVPTTAPTMAPTTATLAPTAAPVTTINATPIPVPTASPTVSSKDQKPSKVSLQLVKSTKKKQMIVQYKNMKKIKGYQISYSENKKFKKSKNVVVKSSISKKIINELKSKKTYYVRVRAYTTVNGKKVYGTWSKSRKVKIK